MKVANLFNSRQTLECVGKMQLTGHVSENLQRTVRSLFRESLGKLSEPEAMKSYSFALSRGK
jgi:hypothetical protein